MSWIERGMALVGALVLSLLLPAVQASAAEDELVIVGGSGVVSDGLADHLGSCTNGTVERLAGADRYATAAAIATRWSSADTVFLATGLDFPDAIAAGPVAGLAGAPLLLTHPRALPPVTSAALSRLAPARVVLLGGPAAISSEIEAGLRARFPEVIRLAGADRYGTAASVSAWYFELGADVAYVATGAGYVDALAAGPQAARAGAPLLLVAKDRVPPATRQELARLAPRRIVIVGSAGVIGEEVEAQLAGLASVGVDRVAGRDRYATAAALAAGAPGSRMFVVTGEDFADGLAATPLTGGAPILLVSAHRLHPVTAEAIGFRAGVPCQAWSPPYPQVGSGKRIIYSNSAQRVWLVDEHEQLVDTYLVSGRQGVPYSGTYSVFSKSVDAWASYGGITMKHMVRFVRPYTWGNRLAYGFHSIPRYPNGEPMQSEEELGQYRSGGCVRQADEKARALYEWAPIGTTVIALP